MSGRKKVVKTEKDVKKKVIAPWLTSIDAWFFMHVPVGYGVAGVPDYIACVPVLVTPEMVGKKIGLFVAPEAKAPKRKNNVSPSQSLQIEAIKIAGGVTGIISSQEDCDKMHLHIHHLTTKKCL